MKRNIIIYGNADKSANGFPTAEAFQRYISAGIFADENSRYRYTQAKPADVIVLSRDGLAFGHFEVSGAVDPADVDREAYPPVKKVYLVDSSASYERPVRLSKLGISRIQFGKPITEEQFKELLAFAGAIHTRTAVTTTSSRYCRICWNTNGWRKPSGDAKEARGSFVATNGFGHEEWLFNYEWCIDGEKYGFLQPVNKHRDLLEGRRLAIALYAKAFDQTMLVATIQNIYVPTSAELRTAFQHMQARGWLEQMRLDVVAVNGRVDELLSPIPESVINVRFRPADVAFCDPMLVFAADHRASRAKRYQVLLWDNDEILAERPSKVVTRSEILQLRAAQDATTADPRHVRLQNRLFKTLCRKHGEAAVRYEDGCVDLKVDEPEGVIFYEIKINTTAKKCIREAMGQLAEYAIYPADSRSVRWVVVGDCPATDDDCVYLKHLRHYYQLPLYYAQFDWESDDVGPLH